MLVAQLIDELRACSSRSDLAKLLGYPAKQLSYLLYKIPDAQKYSSFDIAKKNGGTRTIDAPIVRIKFLQRRLSHVLYESVEDIRKTDRSAFSTSTGFSKGLSIVDNAEIHHARRFVFNVDLKDFFGAIHIGRVRGFFKTDKRFQLNDEVALTIAQIACHNGSLPQGSPCSPVISNLLGTVLDGRMRSFARRNGCYYSRYVDDLTFSTNRKEFPEAIAAPSLSQQGWVAGKQLRDRIKDAGFALNPKKTRMSSRQNKQKVTGLIVNHKPNVDADDYRSTRAMCHHLFSGKKPFIERFYDESVQEPLDDNVIEGRLSFLFYVCSSVRGRSSKQIQYQPTAREKLFKEFMTYKTFYKQQKPLIIPEGKSDKIYLRATALKNYLGDPVFVDNSGAKPALAFQSFGFPERVQNILGLAGGTGNLAKGLERLKDFSKRYSVIKPQSPVIFLIDNDSGAEPVVEKAKKLFGAKFTDDNSEDFVKLMDGIYVVRTPPIAVSNSSYIEAFLPPNILNVPLSGKTFSPASTFDNSKHFGKVRLAQHVEANAGTIGFLGFAPLFDRLKAAIADF